MKKIFVLASFVYDLVTTMERFPDVKETVLGLKFETFPGGKGANQSVAIARLGGDVVVNAKIGDDDYGARFLNLLKEEGIASNLMLKGKESTGIGCVQVDTTGENRICVVMGANYEFNLSDLALDELKKCSIFLTQFEMRKEVSEGAIKIAKENGLLTIVNPAPARAIAMDVYPCIDFITPNEKEIELLTGVKVETIDDAYKAGEVLLKKGVKNVVITLGEKGCAFINNNERLHVSGYKVKPVDTVAAGDSFNGALAFAIANNYPIGKALKFANAMGALTTLSKGAIPSLKTFDEVIDFMAKN